MEPNPFIPPSSYYAAKFLFDFKDRKDYMPPQDTMKHPMHKAMEHNPFIPPSSYYEAKSLFGFKDDLKNDDFKKCRALHMPPPRPLHLEPLSKRRCMKPSLEYLLAFTLPLNEPVDSIYREAVEADLLKYNMQIAASRYFEVDSFPRLDDLMLCGMIKLYPSAAQSKLVLELATFALNKYNSENGTTYKDPKVITATWRAASVFVFYITFCAIVGKETKIFRAAVSYSCSGFEFLYWRPEATDSDKPKDMEEFFDSFSNGPPSNPKRYWK